jgi:glyoxylase-like metal-dependent hydrolase (beta-lactamase superfamily II)
MWIADNVFQIKTRWVSMFVYVAGRSPICFDAGIREGPIKRAFDDLGLALNQVSSVFLTHTDRDHVGGLSLFTSADVYLSVDEEQMVNGTTPRGLRFVHNAPLKRGYKLLGDGDVVRAGRTQIKALATPGHTPGSMSYLVDDSFLFVGDTVALLHGKVRAFSRRRLGDRIHMDITTQTASIRKLAQLKDVSLMATAHTGFTTDFRFAMSN